MSIDLWIYDVSEPHSDFPDNVESMKMRDFSLVMRTKILAELLNKKTQELVFFKTDDGKPYVENSDLLSFNVSHSGSLWGMAVSQNGEEIGFDIENGRERKYIKKMMETYFHPEEFSHYESLSNKQDRTDYFYTLWTQKEAYAKYLGEGLKYNFAEYNFLTKTPKKVRIISGYLFSSQSKRHKTHLSLANSSFNEKQNLILFGDKALKFQIID